MKNNIIFIIFISWYLLESNIVERFQISIDRTLRFINTKAVISPPTNIMQHNSKNYLKNYKIFQYMNDFKVLQRYGCPFRSASSLIPESLR